MNKVKFLIIKVVCIFFVIISVANAQSTQQAVIPIFSQKISVNLPSNFKPAFEKPTKASYLLEFVPKNESVKNWSKMITVSGFKGLASRISLEKSFQFEAASIKRACPNDFLNKVITVPFKQKYETLGVIMGCNKSPALPKNTAEHGVYLFIKGKKDIYMIKKSFRNKVEKIGLNSKSFEKLAPALSSIKVCKNDGQSPKCEME